MSTWSRPAPVLVIFISKRSEASTKHGLQPLLHAVHQLPRLAEAERHDDTHQRTLAIAPTARPARTPMARPALSLVLIACVTATILGVALAISETTPAHQG
jgi:hypothetical protein